jgi:predicted ATP-grasp superfamily ATP-dependent carboligase
LARVLLTVDDHYGTLAAVRALRAGGHAPWLASPRRRVYATLSRAAAGVDLVTPAEMGGEQFSIEVADIARQRGVAAVLPGSESALAALVGREAAFDVPLGVGPAPSLGRAGNKSELAELAAASGLESPPHQVLSHAELEAGAEVPLPAIVKPLNSLVELPAGGTERGWSHRVDTAEGLLRATGSSPAQAWLIQPFIEGELYAVAGVAWHGRVATSVHQTGVRLWPPHSGGSSYALTVPRDEDLDHRLAAMVKLLDWSGIFQAQFLRAQRRFLLIDLNLRVYGSLALAVAAGANLPAVWADLLIGREPQIRDYRPGVSFRAPEKDVRALIHGGGLLALRALRPHRPGIQSVFSMRDPLPLLGLAAKVAALSGRR